MAGMGWDATVRAHRAHCLAGLAVMLLSNLACATKPPEPPLPHISSVLVAPMNFNQDLPEKLDAGAPVVHELLSGLIYQRDIRVSSVPFEEFHDIWIAEAKAVGTLYDAEGNLDPARYDEAVRSLVAAYRKRGAEFDVLLIPYLAVRPGSVVGQSVKWDGTTQRLPLEYRNRDRAHLEARRGLQVGCTSLHVLAYDAEGKRLFERYGGLEVMQRMQIDENGWRWASRDDLFRKRTDLEEGVAIALEPLLENE